MLVLSRKPGQRLQIGNDITITITRVEHGSVKIGVEAPKDVAIIRTELLPTPAASPVVGFS
jgi:carbon storage regulator